MFKTVMGGGLVLADAVISAASLSTSVSETLMYAFWITNAAAALVVVNGWTHHLFEGRLGGDDAANS